MLLYPVQQNINHVRDVVSKDAVTIAHAEMVVMEGAVHGVIQKAAKKFMEMGGVRENVMEMPVVMKNLLYVIAIMVLIIVAVGGTETLLQLRLALPIHPLQPAPPPPPMLPLRRRSSRLR